MICFISINTSVVTLFLFAMLLIILACGTIISEKNGNHKLKWLLFVILLEIGLHFIVLTLVISGFITNIPFFSRGLIPFYYIHQPALYFFVVFNLNENYKFSKKDFCHLIPAVIAFIDNWGFYIGGRTHWKHWANLFSNDFV